MAAAAEENWFQIIFDANAGNAIQMMQYLKLNHLFCLKHLSVLHRQRVETKKAYDAATRKK